MFIWRHKLCNAKMGVGPTFRYIYRGFFLSRNISQLYLMPTCRCHVIIQKTFVLESDRLVLLRSRVRYGTA